MTQAEVLPVLISSSTTQTDRWFEAKLASLESDLADAKAAASAAGNLRIDRSAQQQLAQQVRHLSSPKILRSSRDLAFFEGLLPDAVSGEAGVRINRFRGARSE